VASGWQIRRPIRRFHLTFGNYAIQPCLRCAAGRTLNWTMRPPNAIEESVEEMAEIVGIPGNTEKTRLFYARRKLAELLKAAGIERGWP
jgi:hypothetical protein